MRFPACWWLIWCDGVYFDREKRGTNNLSEQQFYQSDEM